MEFEVKLPSILHVLPHLSPEEVVKRFKRCVSSGERLRWQAVMLKAEGRTAVDIADVCKRREDWVRRTVRAYNEGGPEALLDHRQSNGRAFLVDDSAIELLGAAMRGPSPDGGFWSARKVVRWIAEKYGITVSESTALACMGRAGFTKQAPRPKHPDANEEAQVAFKKGGLRAVFETSFERIPTPKSSSGRKTKGDSA